MCWVDAVALLDHAPSQLPVVKAMSAITNRFLNKTGCGFYTGHIRLPEITIGT